MKFVFDSIVNKPPQNLNDLKKLFKDVDIKDLRKNKKGISYYNFPCAFDIETTSFYRDFNSNICYSYYDIIKLSKKERENFEKLSIMYVWQLGINGVIFVGRTWIEFKQTMNLIKEFFEINDKKRLIIYAHNLGFEFQFIQKIFDWLNVFSLETRKPLYAITSTGFEFRCSYLLSGYALETVAKNLIKYKCEKLKGDLDYHLIRHSKTELTQNEINYCVNDIKIVMFYILEYIENVKNILHIPLTKTGAVRKYTRKKCFYYEKNLNGKTKQVKNFAYKDLINELKFNDLNEFMTVYRAFSGGFTHANANYVDKTLENVTSLDFTSSYPYAMLSELYPMSRGIKISVSRETELNEYINNYCCVFDIEFENIFAKNTYENYISISKCYDKENYSDNNGRLVCAKRVLLTITNIDYLIIKQNYNFEKIRIGNFYVYEKKYLPTEFVKCIVNLYKKKTELKGVEGKEAEYLNSKEMLNSLYGMSVTNPLRDRIIYDKNLGWSYSELNDFERNDELKKDNDNENRFLFYLWGVFITAYARRNLWSAILQIKNDYVYSDTDSVKILNYEKHKMYFELYNNLVIEKLKKCCKFHNINFNDCKPRTQKGIEKIIGVWDFEHTYKRFKTLGAKRYLVECKNILTIKNKIYDYSMTVSGVNKFTAIPYLLEHYGTNGIFENFTNFLKIPPFASGKKILSYIDYEASGKITDFQGVTNDFHELSSVHLEPSEYNLNLTINFINYLRGLKNNF